MTQDCTDIYDRVDRDAKIAADAVRVKTIKENAKAVAAMAKFLADNGVDTVVDPVEVKATICGGVFFRDYRYVTRGRGKGRRDVKEYYYSFSYTACKHVSHKDSYGLHMRHSGVVSYIERAADMKSVMDTIRACESFKEPVVQVVKRKWFGKR